MFGISGIILPVSRYFLRTLSRVAVGDRIKNKHVVRTHLYHDLSGFWIFLIYLLRSPAFPTFFVIRFLIRCIP